MSDPGPGPEQAGAGNADPGASPENVARSNSGQAGTEPARFDPHRPPVAPIEAPVSRTHRTGRTVTGTPVVPDELRVPTRAVLPVGDATHRGLGSGIGGALGRALAAVIAHDALVLGSLLLLAAAVRLAGLPGRGDFDGDQGHDMLTLLRLVRDGVVPLLGPPTSVGDFHHGAAYYYLLAPVVWLFGPDPVAVLAFIAFLGTAAVGVTWWLARAIGGRAAALIAGLLIALSPAAIEESTFLWNPSPIPFFAVVALAAAWRAHQAGRARWWALAVASAGMVIQLHVLGIAFLPPILAFAFVDWRAARRHGDAARARRTVTGVIAGLGLVAILFIPLLLHEVQSDFSETRHALAYFTTPASSGAGAKGLDPFEAFAFTAIRVIGWPLMGVVTSAPGATLLVVSLGLVLGVWRMVVATGEEGRAVRWLGFTVLWGAIALTVLAPSLQTVVAGLPNDHYHAFLDPVVIILVALGLRAMAAGSGLDTGVDRTARTIVAGLVVILIFLDVSRWPPLTQPNGGWPAASQAGIRIAARSPGRVIDVRSLPLFKTAEGIGFPIVAAGGSAIIATDETSDLRPATPGSLIVIACDRLFEAVLTGTCGGTAEAGLLARIPGVGTGPESPLLIDRFDASPRTSISIYRQVGAGGAGAPSTGDVQQLQRPNPLRERPKLE